MTRISELILSFVLNSAWQIIVITLVAMLGSYLLRSASARYRHTFWLAVLLLSVALPIWSILDIAPAAMPTSSTLVRSNKPDETRRGSLFEGVQSPAATRVEEESLADNHLLARRRQLVNATPYSLYIFAFIYGLFILYRLSRLGRLWRQKEGLLRSVQRNELPSAIEAILQRCRLAFNLRRVSLGHSTMARAPATLGARDPLIILPEGLYAGAKEETLLSVVGHEMAHVARRDFALNLICEVVSLPISFHPLTYFIKRQIARARELACDELVTERLLEPKVYARSLLRVANASVRHANQAFMVSIFDADILEERIMRLTHGRSQLSARVGRAIFVTAFSAICVLALTISTFSFDFRAAAQVGQEQGGNASRGSRYEKLLTSAVPDERARAACDAGRSHVVEAIPILISMLGDDSKIQPFTCWDNGRWSPALETFKQPSPGEEAAIALASMGWPAFEPLTDELASANASVRRNAAWAIGELTNMSPGKREGAVLQLISLLSDSDYWVRMATARALGELRDERAGEGLILALSDSQWRVRELAAWALSEMKDQRAVKTLCNVLLTDEQAEVRRAAAEALGEIRSPEAISSLKQALDDPEPRVRAKAGWAIAEIEDIDG